MKKCFGDDGGSLLLTVPPINLFQEHTHTHTPSLHVPQDKPRDFIVILWLFAYRAILIVLRTPPILCLSHAFTTSGGWK